MHSKDRVENHSDFRGNDVLDGPGVEYLLKQIAN
jgi:hypothetical protein